jgi:c(7)-type cytochrome triheme protein
MKLGGTILALALLALASTPQAVEPTKMPRLPKGIALPQGEDSPGAVTFNHDSHVDAAKPACQACHPRAFPMLRSSALPKGAITHKLMEQGKYCGACHGKGKAAFEFEDNCENCHGK